MKSKLEEQLAFLLTQEGIPFLREYKFHTVRKWRFDFAFPESLVAVEVQGGIWMKKGGHNSGKGITRDIEKSNNATFMGWRVLYVTAEMIKDGTALLLIDAAIERFKPTDENL